MVETCIAKFHRIMAQSINKITLLAYSCILFMISSKRAWVNMHFQGRYNAVGDASRRSFKAVQYNLLGNRALFTTAILLGYHGT